MSTSPTSCVAEKASLISASLVIQIDLHLQILCSKSFFWLLHEKAASSVVGVALVPTESNALVPVTTWATVLCIKCSF